jgi:hypothetical protein
VTDAVDRFTEAARAYVATVDGAATQSADAFMFDVAVALAELYAQAMELPRDVMWRGGDAQYDAMSHEEFFALEASLRRVLGERHSYSDVYNVYDDIEVIHFDLADDLAEIYRDIKDGLAGIEAGDEGGALWAWLYAFWSHWGNHSARAQRALHQALEHTGIFRGR